MLERADGERDAARKTVCARANALGSLTGVADAHDRRGREDRMGTEETRLLPENRKIEASSWQSGMRRR
jgi:hypothetical protein